MNRRLSDKAMPLLRFYIGASALALWWNAVSDARSLIAQTTNTTDGRALVWFLGLFGIAVVIDVVINDILPERYSWEKAFKYRHFLLSALALCHIAQLYVGAMENKSAPLLTYYLLNASVIVLASFLDAKKRSREGMCAILYN